MRLSAVPDAQWRLSGTGLLCIGKRYVPPIALSVRCVSQVRPTSAAALITRPRPPSPKQAPVPVGAFDNMPASRKVSGTHYARTLPHSRSHAQATEFDVESDDEDLPTFEKLVKSVREPDILMAEAAKHESSCRCTTCRLIRKNARIERVGSRDERALACEDFATRTHVSDQVNARALHSPRAAGAGRRPHGCLS
jgi:hypothetical protein